MRVGELRIDEASYARFTRLPTHTHEHAYLSFVRSGRMTEIADGEVRVLGPGSVIIKRPDEPHGNTYGPAGTQLSIITLPTATGDAGTTARFTISRSMTCDAGPTCAAALRCFGRIRGAATIDTEALLEDIDRVLDLAGASDATQRSAPPPWLRHVCDCIHDTFLEPIAIADLATLVGVHQTHLTRTFRRAFGCTISEYRRRLRLVHAARRLRETADPIAQIAAQCGFSDQAHLTRVCRSELGTTPARIRSSCRMPVRRALHRPRR